MRNMPFCMPVLLLLFALSGVGVSIHTPSAVAAQTVTATISVGSNPVGVGVNSSTNRIYVANESSNTVSVIDGATNTVISSISVGSDPHIVGVNSSTNRIYVINYFSHTVSVIDGASNTVISTISVGSYPLGVGVNSSTNRIYVANNQSNTVSVIDGATNTVISTISVGSYPWGVGVNSSTNRIYVANTGSNTVSVIDGTTNTVISTISVGSYPYLVGVNASTNRIYVGNTNSNTVSVIDGTGNTVISTISVGTPLGVGVNSSTNRIYVANSHYNTVNVIDGTSNTVISTISVGSYPYAVEVNASTNRIYVANNQSNTVSVIEDSSSSPPTVTTSSATNVTSSSATLNGTVNANGLSTSAWFNYGITSGSYTGTSTTQSVSGSSNTSVSSDISGLSSNTKYYYRIAASSSAGTSYGSETSFTTSAPADTTAPTGSVSINSGDSYTNSTAVTLTLSATDSVGVVGYYASTSSSTPIASASGWNSVTSTTSYSGSVSFTLASGDETKTVYVWYKDSAGNVSSAASDSITLDTTAPIVTITSPTSGDTYTTTSSPLSLSGSASDISSGVKEVTWSNDKGGSGTASGTTYWSVSSISLTSGDNKITVTAKDNAGNTSTDTITVTYNAGSAPTVTTGSATNVTSTSATVTGTVNANGQSTTAWFEYGTVKGTYGNKTTTQTVTGSSDTTVSSTITGLTAGTTYYYRIAAQNNSGTSYGSEMSFQYSTPGSAPTVTTESATDVTTTTATLNGTVNANGISTTAWFEYGTLSGSYGNKTTTKSVSGSTDTKVSIGISGLTAGTTYYYRIVAQNSAGTSYGKEMSFYYSSETKAPTVATEAATNVTDTSATLNGTCNPNGLSTTAWFEYGTLSGTYAYKTSTQSLSGSSYTKVSAAITGLTAVTTYYYRIVAQNSVGTSYGTEMEFYKSPGTGTTPTPVPTPTTTGTVKGVVMDAKTGEGIAGATVSSDWGIYQVTTDSTGHYEITDIPGGYTWTFTAMADGYKPSGKAVVIIGGSVKTIDFKLEKIGTGTTPTPVATPTPTASPAPTLPPLPTPAPTLPPLPTPQVSPSPIQEGIVFGIVNDEDEQSLKDVTVTITGKNSSDSTETDENGYYEFRGLSQGDYTLTYEKEGYQTQTQDISLNEGEIKDLGTVTMEQVVKGKISGYVANIKGDPIESVRLKLKGIKTKVIKTASSDADGFFEFTDLDADTYVIFAKKKGYKKTQQKVVLEEGDSTEIEIEMKKTSKRIKGLPLEEDIQ